MKWKSHASISPYFSSKGHFGHGRPWPPSPNISRDDVSLVEGLQCSAACSKPWWMAWGRCQWGQWGQWGWSCDGKWWEVMGRLEDLPKSPNLSNLSKGWKTCRSFPNFWQEQLPLSFEVRRPGQVKNWRCRHLAAQQLGPGSRLCHWTNWTNF